MKTCTRCGEIKPLDEFHKGPSKKGQGRLAQCKGCKAAYSKARAAKRSPADLERRRRRQAEYLAANRDRINARTRARYREDPTSRSAFERHNRYGLTRADYEALVAAQGGVCAICLLPERAMRGGKVIEFAVDHCHDSGIIRGLLCARCNLALGGFGDDPARLLRAAHYVAAANPASSDCPDASPVVGTRRGSTLRSTA